MADPFLTLSFQACEKTDWGGPWGALGLSRVELAQKPKRAPDFVPASFGFDSRRFLWQKEAMKAAKPAVEKKTSGTLHAEDLRARCNKLTDAERSELRDEAMRLYYGFTPKPARAHRR